MNKAETKKIERVIKGTVTSDKMDKTVTILVSRVKTHPLYHKQFSVSRKYKAHDENNEYKIGDVVEIATVRPISKEKTFSVIRKIS
jgi:small subunit ribosomal protein S17